MSETMEPEAAQVAVPRELAPHLNTAAARGLDTITRAVLTAGFEAVKLTFMSAS
jgi:hypothetical protein